MVAPAPSLGGLAALTLRRRREEAAGEEFIAEELERCRQRFGYWLFAYARTQDEHDPTSFAKPFPRLDYIRILADIVQFERRVAVEKSRQLMMSWLLCAFTLWLAIFRPNVLAFVQSKKEEDAADRLDRIYQIYFRLPEWMRRRFPINLNSGRPGQQLYTDLYFTWQPDDEAFFGTAAEGVAFADLVENRAVRSRIWAIPQGSEVLRQYTATLVFSDETGFQEKAGEAYGAIMPTLSADSWYLMVSTASPGFFESVTKDRDFR